MQAPALMPASRRVALHRGVPSPAAAPRFLCGTPAAARALTRSLALSCACCVLCHYSQYVCGTGAFRDRCVVYKGAGKLTSWRSQLYQSDWSSLSSADLHANIRLERAKVREQECSNPPQLKRLSASPAGKELAKQCCSHHWHRAGRGWRA